MLHIDITSVLTVGMIPDLVLNEEDKKVRFRKLIQKKEHEKLSNLKDKLSDESGYSSCESPSLDVDTGYLSSSLPSISTSTNQLCISDECNANPNIRGFADTAFSHEYFQHRIPKICNIAQEEVTQDDMPLILNGQTIAQLYDQLKSENTFRQIKRQEIVEYCHDKCFDRFNTISESDKSTHITSQSIVDYNKEALDLSSKYIMDGKTYEGNDLMTTKCDEMSAKHMKSKCQVEENLLIEYVHKKFCRKIYSLKRNNDDIAYNRRSVISFAPKYKVAKKDTNNGL